jgi:tRNA(fMet)-specific endonuclease VapC
LRLLLDTNRLTDVLEGDDVLAHLIESAAEVWIPFVALAEIKAGFLGGNRRTKNEASLEFLMRISGVEALFADRETTEVYARLFYSMRRAGTPIPTNDLWIAALAVQHGLALVTRDRHFARIPQVQRLS